MCFPFLLHCIIIYILAITQIFPELKGLLDGRAVRVPMTVGGSIVDAVFEMKRSITVNEINDLMKTYSRDVNGGLVGILGYEERPLVSTDYNNDSRSGIVDSGSTMVINETMLKMYVWYDNEWGYSCRMWDLIQMVVGRFNDDNAGKINFHEDSDEWSEEEDDDDITTRKPMEKKKSSKKMVKPSSTRPVKTPTKKYC